MSRSAEPRSTSRSPLTMVDVLLRYAPPGPDGSQVTFRVSRVPAEKKVSALRKAFLRAFAQKHGGSPTVEKLLRCADGAVLSEAATVGEALPRGEAVEVLWTAATPARTAAAGTSGTPSSSTSCRCTLR